jgi:hypothetical protein
MRDREAINIIFLDSFAPSIAATEKQQQAGRRRIFFRQGGEKEERTRRCPLVFVVDVDVSNVADRKTRLRIGKNSRIPESDVTKNLDYPRTLTLINCR